MPSAMAPRVQQRAVRQHEGLRQREQFRLPRPGGALVVRRHGAEHHRHQRVHACARRRGCIRWRSDCASAAWSMTSRGRRRRVPRLRPPRSAPAGSRRWRASPGCRRPGRGTPPSRPARRGRHARARRARRGPVPAARPSITAMPWSPSEASVPAAPREAHLLDARAQLRRGDAHARSAAAPRPRISGRT